MFTRIALTLALSVMMAPSFADEVKNARSNDVASKYILKDNGDLFRTVNGNKCQITTRVQSFKVSQHPDDVAMIYYKRNGDLYILRNTADKSSCPKADTKVIVSDIKKYTVVSNTDTKIVNLTLDYSGRFVGWDNKRAVITADNVTDYQNNSCFGSRGKAFSSYVAFGITTYGSIVKIKGNTIDGNRDSNYWSSIEEFKRYNNVCR